MSEEDQEFQKFIREVFDAFNKEYPINFPLLELKQGTPIYEDIRHAYLMGALWMVKKIRKDLKHDR